MPISTLMIILWGDVIPKEKQLKTIRTKNKKNKDKGQAFGHIKQLFIFRLKFISFILKYPVKDSGHMKLQPFLDSFFFFEIPILDQKCWLHQKYAYNSKYY